MRNEQEDVVDELFRRGIDDRLVEDLVQVVSELHPFQPSVRFEEGGQRAYIWLPQFGLYSEGADFDEAAWDMVDEVLEYVEEWEQGLSTAPNQAVRAGWVRRVQLNRTREGIYRLLFAA